MSFRSPKTSPIRENQSDMEISSQISHNEYNNNMNYNNSNENNNNNEITSTPKQLSLRRQTSIGKLY